MSLPPGDPVVIDGGDRDCVRLLLELRAHVTGLPAGTVIHLIASDPAAPVDRPAWCHLTGHAYRGTVPATRPTYAMRTVPAPAGTDPASPGGAAPDPNPCGSCPPGTTVPAVSDAGR